MKNLLVTIVDRGDGEALMQKLRRLGAPGGTLINGRGTASRTFLSLLGLGEHKKEILFSVLEENTSELCLKASAAFPSRGCSFLIKENGGMEDKWRMLSVVAEKGYSEDIMATARKAGARGGTVINAHGTANEEDVRFFGSALVPEKEMLLIVADESTADKVDAAIKAMPCMQEKGMGILFSVPVTDFSVLGG